MAPSDNLRISLVQGDTRWHDAAGNRAYYGGLIAPLHGKTDLVLLPETFTSGFSNDAVGSAETMDGETVAWMRSQAAALDAVVCGSVAIRDGDAVYNRLVWARPDGTLATYDKRHLFRYAGEHERYAPGCERLVVELRGWRINPLVCYDLRFPVFARNRLDPATGEPEFDLQLYVANWPAVRGHAWSTLLRARAIENLCYVAGLNRIGRDGNGLEYDGGSAVIDFMGVPVSQCTDAEVVVTSTLLAAPLAAHRRHFPALVDGDRFELG
jgi:omega-amidase